MELSAILKPGAVRVMSAASSKKRLFQEIGDNLCRIVIEGICSPVRSERDKLPLRTCRKFLNPGQERFLSRLVNFQLVIVRPTLIESRKDCFQ